MTLAIWKAVVRLQPTSGLPEDERVNTFTFGINSSDSIATDVAGLGATLQNNFYNYATPTTGDSVAGFLSADVSRVSLPVIDFYDITPRPDFTGSPVGRWTFTSLDAALDNSRAPAEVACCLSFHGDLSGISEIEAGGAPGPADDVHPRARRRGRVFIGPLNMDALNASTGNPTADLITTLAEAGTRLLNLTSAPPWTWYVRSKTAHGSSQ